MATMLKHVPTGEMYPYNENLARRSDMEQVIPVDPQFAEAAEVASGADEPKPAKAKRKPRAKPKAKTPAKQAPAPVVEESANEEDDDDFGDLDLSGLEEDAEAS